MTEVPTFRLLTFNVGLLNMQLLGRTLLSVPYAAERVRSITAALAKVEADVLCLQEVFQPKYRDELVKGLRQTFPYIAEHPNGGVIRLTNGLLVMSKYPLSDTSFLRFSSAPRYERLLVRRGAIAARIDGVQAVSGLNIVNVHTTAGVGGTDTLETNSIRQEQLREVHETITQRYVGPTILCGDFNSGPEASADNYYYLLSLGYADAFNSFTKHRKLIETARAMTWDPQNALNQFSKWTKSPAQRIDHVFLNGDAQAGLDIVDATIMFMDPEVPVDEQFVTLSDHYGLLVAIRGHKGSNSR